jgi:enoyl-CoA hydratase/carnithine racemase
MTLVVGSDGAVRVIAFHRRTNSHPFSCEMQLALTEAARSVGDDASVQSVVFAGGVDKLFCAHRASFQARAMVPHFENVLGRSSRNTAAQRASS